MTTAGKLTIRDAFDLPKPEDLRAMAFVIRLRDAAPDSDEVRKLVRDYVITPAVATELPRLLNDMKQVFDRGEELGRFVHGSFGSGKSHFMTMLALLLENVPAAWDRFRPICQSYRAAAQTAGRDAFDPETWVRDAKLLVVRIHMLSVKGKATGLDRAVYDRFNETLRKHAKAPFEFLNVGGILEEVRKEAADYGDMVWKRLETERIVGSRDEFEAIAKGTASAREHLARAWLQYKGRDPNTAGIDPRWSEGLRRMGEHAKAQGFNGIVLLIDELLLWLSEKSGQEFAKEINDLNVIVDHSTGQRPAPIFVLAAVQRDLRDFFPDLVDESQIREHLDHHKERFSPYIMLEDVELRHIVRERVLRPKDKAAVAAAVQGLAAQHQKILPALLANGDVDYLKDVYPFHPALIEMLVDVTSLMQRERSALRLLYELLVVHHPDLPLGEFLPVGDAFDAIFPRAGVEASKKVELMQDVHRQFHTRLAPAMRQMAEDPALQLNAERLRALSQVVKTVLLGEVSPRLKQGGLTIERLVQLNSADVEGETYRSKLLVTETDLLVLSQRVPDLQIIGQGKGAIVAYTLGRVSLSESLARARSKTDNLNQRFKVFYGALKAALEIADLSGFEDGGPNVGDWDLVWRKTRRRGKLKLANVREMAYEDFDPPPGTFAVLIDYPWDEPGHTVDEDRHRAINVRKKKGLVHTVCWLPRHASETELQVITELAAVRYLLTAAGQQELLDTVPPPDRAKVLEQAGIRQHSLEGQLNALLKDVYVAHGEFFALINDVDSSRPRETLRENLEHIAALIMDRRCPQHPHFLVEPRRGDLETLLAWMKDAGETDISIAYDEDTAKVLRNLAQPLELVNLGQTKAALRLDSRYIKDVLQKVDADSVSWSAVAEHLRDAYGFQQLVIDLFLAFVCQRDHRALNPTTGEPIEVRIGMSAGISIRLQRGKLLEPAAWSRLRELGGQLFSQSKPPAHRSLQAQDRFCQDLQGRAREARTVLQTLHETLVVLDASAGPRCSQVAQANERLAPLAASDTDSFTVLGELLGRWPDEPSDPLRFVVRQAAEIRDALADLQTGVRNNLASSRQHPELGTAVSEHLEALDRRLKGTQVEQPLTRAWVAEWNQGAEGLITNLLKQPVMARPETAATPKGAVTEGPVGGLGDDRAEAKTVVSAPGEILLEEMVDTGKPKSVSAFVQKAKDALGKLEHGPVRVALVRKDGEE
jgi:hypothetical protein